jgi:hypothetical protein
MAKISTYPIVSVPDFSDLLIGTDVENLNETKNFTIGDIADLIIVGSYVPYTGAIADVDLGTHSITASSFIVPGGLASQFVKADGSLDSTVYQPAGNYMTGLSGEATASGPGVSAVVLSNGAVIGKVLTGLTVTGGSISSSDSILQAFGKLQNQVNSLYGGAIYQGTWNALTNNPLIQSGVGTKGYYYVVNVAGTTNIDGITDWHVGDWIIFDGTAWQQVDNTDTVVSVNGQVGVVVLTTTDIAEGTNLYYTDVRARGALLLTTVGSSGASTYNSATGTFNIPNYTLSGLGGVPSSRLLTINGTQYDLSADRSWSVGTVTSIGTSGPLTGGTITGSGTIGITQSGVSTDGYLSSTDWNTFNNKQNALTNPVTGTGTVYYLPMWSGLTTLTDSIISYTANVINYNYNSASGATVNYININGTPYTYTIQMNNVGTRQTYHSYTDGNIIQRIGVNDVSRNLSTGQLVLPSYTTLTSFTGTTVGYIGFDASGNILTVPVPTAGITGSGATGQVAYWNGTSSQTGSNNFRFSSIDNTLSITATGGFGSTRIPISVTSAANTRVIIDSSATGASFNTGLALSSSSSIKWSIATFGTTNDFTFYNETLLANALFIKGSTNNVSIGSGTDSGQRLQVYGDAFIKGSGATSATIALQIQNSSSQNILQVFNDGMLKFGNANNAPLLYTGGGPTINSQALTIGLNNYNSWGNGESAFTILTNTNTTTAGTSTANSLTGTFAPGSGSHNHNFLRITATINQTGGANGITRGLFIQPFITAAADWRSIEWSNNSGWGLYGAGTANNYLGGSLGIGATSPAAVLDVRGSLEVARFGTTGSDNYINVKNTTRDFYIGGDSSRAYIWSTSAHPIDFFTANVVRMRLFNTGNLLLQNGGTFTDAGFRLDVNGTARVSTSLEIIGTAGITFGGGVTALSYAAGSELRVGNAAWSSVNLYLNTVSKYSHTASLTTITNTTINLATATVQLAGVNALTYSGTDIRIGSVAAGFNTLSMYVAGGEKARITSAGRLLLGTTTESTFLLDVNGTARVSSDLTTTSTNATGAIGTLTGARTFIDNATTYGRVAAYNFTTNAWLPLLTGDSQVVMSNSTSARTEKLVGVTASFSGVVKMLNISTVFGASESLGIFAPGTYSSPTVFPAVDSNSIGILDINGSVAPIFMCGSKFSIQIGTGTNSKIAQFSPTTGNFIIQNGGTFTDNASALIQMNSTTKGFLPPRLTTTQKNAISSPAAGLQVYDTTLNQMSYYNGTTWINF